MNSELKIKVLVVDDHTLFAEGTVSLLSSDERIWIVGIASTGYMCLDIISGQKPDVILLDIILPDLGGIELIGKILAISPNTKIIMLTGQSPQEFISTALNKGAQGFLLKDCTKNEMIDALIHVAKGGVYFSNGMAPFLKKTLVGENHNLEAPSKLLPYENDKLLTLREKETMNLVRKGLSNIEIGLALGIKSRTVNFHVGNILTKLGVNTRLQAAMFWSNVEKKR